LGKLPVAGFPRIARHANAKPVELARAYLYRAELAYRTHNHELARSSLALAQSLELTDVTDDEKAVLADEVAHVTSLVSSSQPSSGHPQG
jgi:hypothetical protein